MADASGDYFSAAAVKIDPPNLAMRRTMQHVVARLAYLQVELFVRTDGDELPAVRLVLRQIAVDDRRFRRLVEIGLDIFNLGDLRKLGDVERALVNRESVRTIKTLGDCLDLGLVTLFYDGRDLVAQAGADEHGALVTDAQ